MRANKWLIFGVVVGTAGFLLGYAGSVYSQRRAKEETMPERLARVVRVKVEVVNSFLKELGPAVTAEIIRGNQVILPGLGTLRVVRVAEHRDLRNGRPVVIPATNYVEFVPTGGLVQAANSATARPAATVPAFEFVPKPNGAPSERAPKVRATQIRTR
jgi:nucleoid DNA-binding protein